MSYHLVTDAERARFLALYEQGLNDSEIADEIGVNRRTVIRWRQEQGLPAKHKRGADKTYHTPEEARAGEKECRKSTKAYMIATQRCLRCHQQDAYTLNGRHYCADCAERLNEASHRWKERNREKVNANARAKTAQRRADGLCITCGKPSGEKSHCPRCSKKRNRQALKRRIEAGENFPRGDNGLCWQCNKRLAVDGHDLCEDCLEKAINNLRENVWPARRGGPAGPCRIVFGRGRETWRH